MDKIQESHKVNTAMKMANANANAKAQGKSQNCDDYLTAHVLLITVLSFPL